MKKIAMKISSVFTGVSAFLLSSTGMLFAEGEQSASSYLDSITRSGNGANLLEFVKNLLNTVIALAGLVCVVMLVVAGYSYITAAGDENKVKKASQTLTWAVIGLGICFVAVLLVQYVLTTLLKVD
ncbi:MAG TPA: pilin [Candidatus Dojkabacteria bacterium]|nr:pilin [Candidatus Dojkabacteria bacterium]